MKLLGLGDSVMDAYLFQGLWYPCLLYTSDAADEL